MSKIYHFIGFVFIGILTLQCQKSNSNEPTENTDTIAVQDTSPQYALVRIETHWGAMTFWLYEETPLHKAHFLEMVENGFFNGQTFNRIVRNFVIQGGCRDTSATGHTDYPVPLEIDSQITHVYGALGMGRYGDQENPEKQSNGCQIYIVSDTAGEHGLDYNYTVFGTLVEGEKSLDSLNKIQTGFMNDIPKDTIVEMQVSIVNYSEQVLQDSFQFEIPNL